MNTQKVALKLRMLREMHNYTQDYVADFLDISTSTYSLLEKGQATLSLDRIEKIAELYRIELSDLVRLNEQMLFNQATSLGSFNQSILNNQNNNPVDEVRRFYHEIISRLDEQNRTLINLLTKLSENGSKTPE